MSSGFLSQEWKLTSCVRLYDWQKRAIDAFPADHRGVAKIVTGAGKTLFAIALAIKMRQDIGTRFKVLIIVPSKILQGQWAQEILHWTNINASEIGFLGNGHTSDIIGKSIVIAVVNSAIRNIDILNDTFKEGSQSLMILDECHRYLGKVYSQILDVCCLARLGLSATPNAVSYWPLEILGCNQRIGDLYFELAYSEAVKEQCVSDFELIHVGLSLSPLVRARYDRLTRQIDKCRDGDTAKMLQYVGRRLEVLYGNPDRESYAISVLVDLLKRCPDSRVLAFHERISSIDNFVRNLKAIGIQAVAVHSKKDDIENQKSVNAFKSSLVQVLVTGKSLTEGFDVPIADIGIIVSSTTSPIRTIQTVGRLLRRKSDKRPALIYRLFVLDTVEEKVFARIDFDAFAGLARNRFCKCVKDTVGAIHLVEDDSRHVNEPRFEFSHGRMHVGDIVKCRPTGFYFTQHANNEFVVAREKGRYKVLNVDEMRDLYNANSLKKGTWYFCTDTGMVLLQITKGGSCDRWCCCGKLAKGFRIRTRLIK